MLKPAAMAAGGRADLPKCGCPETFLGGAVFASTSTAEVDKHLLLDAIRTFVRQL